MLGNFIADDISRKEEALLSPDILQGVVLHRQIDEFTDGHHSFISSTERLRPDHRKYAPVVLDILNDHLLSRTWAEFHNEEEESFHAYVYKSFADQVNDLPPKSSLHVHVLLQYRYLSAYGTKKGLQDVLARMDRRTKFPSDFESGVNHLYDDLDFYLENFKSLYTDLIDFVSEFRTLG